MKQYLFRSIFICSFICSFIPLIANSTIILDTGTSVYGDYADDESVTFSLINLAEHTEVTLNFDVFIMDSWDGIQAGYGPDYFGFKIDGIEQKWSFENFNPTPANESNIDSTWVTGTYNMINLSHLDRFFDNYADGFTIAHTGSTLKLEFFGQGLQSIDDESWRIQNILLTTVSSSTIPEPTSLALLGLGLVGFGFSRKKKTA